MVWRKGRIVFVRCILWAGFVDVVRQIIDELELTMVGVAPISFPHLEETSGSDIP